MYELLLNEIDLESLIMTKEPTLKVQTTPLDINGSGSIFGGWLMSQIDQACGIVAREVSKGLVATVAVKELTFIKPIFVHDVVSFYSEVTAIGTTSITVKCESWVKRHSNSSIVEKVSDAVLVFVALEKPGTKRTIIK